MSTGNDEAGGRDPSGAHSFAARYGCNSDDKGAGPHLFCQGEGLRVTPADSFEPGKRCRVCGVSQRRCWYCRCGLPQVRRRTNILFCAGKEGIELGIGQAGGVELPGNDRLPSITAVLLAISLPTA